MTPEQISGYILLVLMSILAILATHFVSGKKHDGHGVYYIAVNAIFRGRIDYMEWIRNNTVYYWLSLLVIILCPTVLSLAPSFRTGNMIVRPEIMIWINPILWTAILMSYRWFFKQKK